MQSSARPARPDRVRWIAAPFVGLGFALIGAFWAAAWIGDAFWPAQPASPAAELPRIALGCVAGVIGGWSMLRAPRATLFVLVFGWISPPLFLLLCAGLLAAPLLPARREQGSPEPALDASARSDRACPVCGEHRVRVVRPPRIDVQGVSPWLDLYAMGDPNTLVPPAIACEACEAQWADLAAFEAATATA